MQLPSYRITCDDGTTYITSMNATLEEARDYFLFSRQVEENPETGEETFRTVISVEQPGEKAMVQLTNPIHIRSEYNKRASSDERRKVDWHLYEYAGSDGERYRKAFETLRGIHPEVPQSGTHQTINAVKIQWKDDRTVIQILQQYNNGTPMLL